MTPIISRAVLRQLVVLDVLRASLAAIRSDERVYQASGEVHGEVAQVVESLELAIKNCETAIVGPGKVNVSRKQQRAYDELIEALKAKLRNLCPQTRLDTSSLLSGLLALAEDQLREVPPTPVMRRQAWETVLDRLVDLYRLFDPDFAQDSGWDSGAVLAESLRRAMNGAGRAA